MEYKGVNPWCKNGHDKREVGVKESNNRCAACERESKQRNRALRRRSRDSYSGEAAGLPGLKGMRERLGLSQRALASAAGIDKQGIRKAEDGGKLGLASRRKLERAVARLGGSVPAMYGNPPMKWRPCEADKGHPAWFSATIEECPRCSGTRSDVPRRGTLSPEQQKKLMEKVPDDARFDHALNEKGRDIRAGWLEHVSAGEETEVWE